MTPAPLLTVEEVAQILRVGTSTIYRLIDGKELRARRIIRSLRIDPRDLADYVRRADTFEEAS